MANYETGAGNLRQPMTGSTPQAAATEDGSEFWLIALIVLIVTGIISMFTGSHADQNTAAINESGEKHVNSNNF
jgi:hypothetical protein